MLKQIEHIGYHWLDSFVCVDDVPTSLTRDRWLCTALAARFFAIASQSSVHIYSRGITNNNNDKIPSRQYTDALYNYSVYKKNITNIRNIFACLYKLNVRHRCDALNFSVPRDDLQWLKCVWSRGSCSYVLTQTLGLADDISRFLLLWPWFSPDDLHIRTWPLSRSRQKGTVQAQDFLKKPQHFSRYLKIFSRFCHFFVWKISA